MINISNKQPTAMVAKHATNFLFNRFQYRFYGALFLLILVFWLYRCFGPNQPVAVAAPLASISGRMMAGLKERYDQVLALRRDRPRTYFAYMSAFLMSMAVLGHLLAGSTVVLVAMACSAMAIGVQKWQCRGTMIEELDGALNSKGLLLVFSCIDKLNFTIDFFCS